MTDASSTIYNNVDLDGDGLPGYIESLLDCNPLVADNPLNIPTLTLSSTLSGVVTIPLQLDPNLDGDTPFTLLVDGQDANAIVQKLNGYWVAQWDTTTTANGFHALSLRFNYPDPYNDSLRHDFVGDTSFTTVNNPLTFTALNSTFCDKLVIDATVNNGASTYSISVYDAATYSPGTSAPLTTLSGSVSNGKIETSWDLTDGNGNTIANGPVTCEFSFNGGPATETKTFPKFLHNPYNGTFTLAWGVDNVSSTMKNEYLLRMSDVGAQITGFYNPFPDPDYIYNILPYGSSGNVNNPGGDISFTFSADYSNSKDQLKQALLDSGNFFWVGHGNPNYISPDPSGSPRLTAIDIGKYLNNPVTIANGNTYVRTPYKLVILFACTAYSKAFASAFGITHFTKPRTPSTSPVKVSGNLPGEIGYYLSKGRSTSTVASYTADGKIPQAYVAWPCNVNRPNNQNDVDYEGSDIVNMFAKWQDSSVYTPYTITDCVNLLANSEAYHFTYNPDPDTIIGVYKWELSGCYDLRITDRNP